MSLIIRENFGCFLYESLKKSFAEHKVEVSEEADFYIHNLLTEYLRTPKFKTVSGLSNSEKPLALMVQEAYDAPTISEQLWRFVAIGDHSFFISSFLDGHVNRNFENKDYCLGIGSNSYLQAKGLFTSSEKKLSELYYELGMNFVDLVVVAESALEHSFKK
ncbi:MAG: hypothetical protein V1914_03430 [archaeon]